MPCSVPAPASGWPAPGAFPPKLQMQPPTMAALEHEGQWAREHGLLQPGEGATAGPPMTLGSRVNSSAFTFALAAHSTMMAAKLRFERRAGLAAKAARSRGSAVGEQRERQLRSARQREVAASGKVTSVSCLNLGELGRRAGRDWRRPAPREMRGGPAIRAPCPRPRRGPSPPGPALPAPCVTGRRKPAALQVTSAMLFAPGHAGVSASAVRQA